MDTDVDVEGNKDTNSERLTTTDEMEQQSSMNE